MFPRWLTESRFLGELLESGQFASNVELAEVAGYERSLLAEKLWYLYHDLSEGAREAGYLSCLSEIKGNGFPEETRRLTEQLSDPAFRQTLKEEYAAFWTAYQQDLDLPCRASFFRPFPSANRSALIQAIYEAVDRMGFETGNISDLMFYELIDKIVVYEAEGVSRARTQKVDIYFNYVGQVNIDYTPEEVAEIQAQEAQTAAERLQKQRAREKAYREKRKAERLAANGGELVKKQVCPQCGKIFIPASSHQTFCSEGCCHQARQDQKQAEREAERGQHYYRQRICAVCGRICT